MVILAILLTLVLATAVPAAAHAPEFPSGHVSLEDAMEVHDPTKSWAIYSQLHEGGEAQYYLLEMRQGESITVSLTVPRSSTDQGFLPSVALMGPGIEDDGPLPAFVEVPDGDGVQVVASQLPAGLSYEPFSPSVFYELAEISVSAPRDGDYYLAVFDENTGGSYCLAVGLRESFTAEEWLLIPFSAISIYRWEGQSLPTVLAPPIIAFVAGSAIMVAASRRRPQPVDALWVLAAVAGLLMVASGISLLYQMLWSLARTGVEPTMVVTILFAALPLALGLAALRIAHRGRAVTGIRPSTRLALAIIGGLGLLLWAGWIVGPALAFVAAILPGRWSLRRLGGPPVR